MAGSIRIGVIGIGFGQQVHVPAFRNDPRCEVVAIAAQSKERAQNIATALNIPEAFGDWRRLLESKSVDAVSIATPPRIQSEIALAAFEAGKSVFCEKPLALSVDAAEKMLRAAQLSKKTHMVDFEFPDIDEWIQTKEILQSGKIGTLLHVAVTWNVETYANRTRSVSWKTNAGEGGGALNSCVSHCFQYLEWMLNPISALTCSLHKMPGDTRSADTLAVLLLELHSGIPVQINMSTHSFQGNGHRIEFFGDQGSLRLENPTADYVEGFQIWLATRSSPVFARMQSQSGRNFANATDGRIEVVGRLINRFISAILNGEEARPNFKDGLRVQKLLRAAVVSSQSGRRVSMESI